MNYDLAPVQRLFNLERNNHVHFVYKGRLRLVPQAVGDADVEVAVVALVGCARKGTVDGVTL